MNGLTQEVVTKVEEKMQSHVAKYYIEKADFNKQLEVTRQWQREQQFSSNQHSNTIGLHDQMIKSM